MQPVLSILREVRDPRAPNARHELSAILFIALAATLCGQRTCVHIADFGAVNEAELAEIVDLPHGAPSHDCFSRLFRLLDPAELAKTLARFVGAIRAGPARCEAAVSVQPVHVEGAAGLDRAPPEAAAASRSRPAHHALPFFPKSSAS